ncbi:MAG: endonuclease [Polyangiaceae bacterium]|nr:endonuclease [Polyangiaceae bacterium]
MASAGCCFRGKVELSWEHAVPASAFGRSFSAWRDGDPACVDARGRHFKGRKCASKVSAEFRRLEGDLYNLYPAIRALNEARGDRPLGEVEGEERRFGACDFELGPDAAEPRPAARGELARAYLYMDAAYPGLGLVGAELRPLLLRWDAEDPPDAWERERARRIAAIQGNENPFVARAR